MKKGLCKSSPMCPCKAIHKRTLISFESLGLTRHSSRPAYGGRLTFAVSLAKYPCFIKQMIYKTAFHFASVIQRCAGRFAGLRLGVVRRFLAVLAVFPCGARGNSYPFASVALPGFGFWFSPGEPFSSVGCPRQAFGSNISFKLTRLRRAAYLSR